MDDLPFFILMIFLLVVVRRRLLFTFFFFNDTATTEIYTLSLHDALPISSTPSATERRMSVTSSGRSSRRTTMRWHSGWFVVIARAAGSCRSSAARRSGRQDQIGRAHV